MGTNQRPSADLAGLPRVQGFEELTQISVITGDLESTTAALARAMGAGSFKVLTLDAPQLFNRTYRNEPDPWSAKGALTWVGGTQLEVIQPIAGRSVYADFLRRTGGRHGVEHIYLERADRYESTLERLRAAGYPLVQHAQMNAAGKLGVLPMPALPGFLAPKLAARFGYTSSFDQLKVDLEVAKFPPGVTQRLALRAAIAEKWIPDAEPRCFENLPEEAFLADLDGLAILCNDVDAVATAYGKLTDRPLEVVAFEDEPWPGRGRMARFAAGTVFVALVRPESGVLADRLAELGEGIQLVRARPARAGVAAARRDLAARGWTLQATAPTIAAHPQVPFGLWLDAAA